MTRKSTKTLLVAVIGVWLSTSAPAIVEGQVVGCEDRMQPIGDQRMQRSIDGLKAKNPGIEFQSDDQPCRHAQETRLALARTVGRNYLSRISGYELVKIINGEGYLTIERFKTRSQRDLFNLEIALQRRTPRKLAVEANTNYEVFVSGESLVLMISSAVGYESNATLFRQVQNTF